jgi:hypothetical protein
MMNENIHSSLIISRCVEPFKFIFMEFMSTLLLKIPDEVHP